MFKNFLLASRNFNKHCFFFVQRHRDSNVYARYEEEIRKCDERRGRASSSPSVVPFMRVDSSETPGAHKNPIKKYPGSHPTQIKFNEAITNWIIEDSINFNVVNTAAFKGVIEAADKFLNVPDRRTVANNISKKYVKVCSAKKSNPLREVDFGLLASL